MADKVEATFHGSEDGPMGQPSVLGSTTLLTFVDGDGRLWVAGATLTRLRPKDAPWDSEVTVQLTADNTPDWKLREIRVVEP